LGLRAAGELALQIFLGDAVPVPTISHVSSTISNSLVLNRVPPVYPPIAKESRVQGAVLLSTWIAEDGSIKQLNVISGHPYYGMRHIGQAFLDA
jgi:protein TonB